MGWGGREEFQGPGPSKCREHSNELDIVCALADIRSVEADSQSKSLKERAQVQFDLEGRERTLQAERKVQTVLDSEFPLGGR